MAISRQELDSLLQNAVCYVHEAEDRRPGAVAPLEVSRPKNRALTAVCRLVLSGPDSAYRFDDSVLSKVRIERCLNLAALLDQSLADVDLLVIEDIRGLFNLEFAKNYTGGAYFSTFTDR
ncbi:hypothetical protein KL932_003465 [Ogataea haglerorum]|uniref:Uncharacterized protein n=1 Tax=Ogataea haglerorum TaxID=1937702 RepID=A0ABQ7RH31_9ASCO|nr:uncharacterized protein KL911_002827 [Ogataea haglerorum]KAG7704943.1 hypothetical protein KL950_004116 [Ogataea haglerorum]KAG7738474.1 hypothetical protein KL923_003171 [Ogataea haglerorum]KAG7739371.1 hypothetical protein KL932_003465 [Ogataea haglerorum]KAG7747706.1 hypothetical protein KL912_003078 [Ogataea haglerorum]KAG7753434.1 hypothetical protein KL911_002827 [Ogataea haglerorum]